MSPKRPTSSVLASNNRQRSQTTQPWTSLCITASNGSSSFLAAHRGNGYALRACHQMMMMTFCVSAVIAVVTCLPVCLSVTHWYCVKTAKPILQLFRPSGSPIILVILTPCADTKFQGEPLQRGAKYTGVGKMAIFD